MEVKKEVKKRKVGRTPLYIAQCLLDRIAMLWIVNDVPVVEVVNQVYYQGGIKTVDKNAPRDQSISFNV